MIQTRGPLGGTHIVLHFDVPHYTGTEPVLGPVPLAPYWWSVRLPCGSGPTRGASVGLFPVPNPRSLVSVPLYPGLGHPNSK